jgi:hypothetical protein
VVFICCSCRGGCRSGEEVDGFKKGDRFFVRDFAGNRLEFAGI